MTATFAKRIEILANISMIAIAFLGSLALLRSLYQGIRAADKRPVRAVTATSNAGTRLVIPGVNWAQHQQTVVLVLSTQCHFCTDSAPFYRKLVETVRTRDIGFVALLPQEKMRSEAYLKGLGVSVHQVVQGHPSLAGVKGTPGLILADHQGTVIHSWMGRVPPEREHEILARLK